MVLHIYLHILPNLHIYFNLLPETTIKVEAYFILLQKVKT